MADFNSSLRIAATGLHAQTARMRVIAENLANVDSAGKKPGEEPYRRRVPTFETVFDPDVGGKIVEVFALEGEFDPATISSAEFELEWPPRSGRMKQFPELDRVAWLALKDARRLILNSQLPLLAALEKVLAASTCNEKEQGSSQGQRAKRQP